MAITKLLHMKECKRKNEKSRHLKNAIRYVMNPEKTRKLLLVKGFGVSTQHPYQDMMLTKEFFGKEEGRQGYHFIMAFAKGETTVETVEEVAGLFIQEYLSDYEVLLAVHDDTEHLHAHMVFNSVSFQSGKKYHYKNGDWKKDIQPITDRLCKERGLSMILTDDLEKIPGIGNLPYPEWEGKELPLKTRIKKDLDSALAEVYTYPAFLNAMRGKGYEIREGKHLSFKPPFDTRFYKGYRLEERFSETAIRSFLAEKELQIPAKKNPAPEIKEKQLVFGRRRIPEPKAKRSIRILQVQTFKRLMRQNTYLFEQEITTYAQLQEKKQQVLDEWKNLCKERRQIYRQLKKPDLEPEVHIKLKERHKQLNEEIKRKSKERYLIADIEKESITYKRLERRKEEQKEKEADRNGRDR